MCIFVLSKLKITLIVQMFHIKQIKNEKMCRYLTANGLCAASDGAGTPFPPCEFICRDREFRECHIYREYMTELFLHTQYVYDADSDSVIESLSVEPDKNYWEENIYEECPF